MKAINSLSALPGYLSVIVLSLLSLPQAKAQTWSTISSMATARFEHTATLMPNGRVLVVGGANLENHTYISQAEWYDPTAAAWTPAGVMITARREHTATLLPNGKVLVTGGFNGSYLSNVELYDPTTGIWTATNSMSVPRGEHSATLLPNGKVLVMGGYNGGFLSSAEIYDPATGTWTATGSMAAIRGYFTATLLPNGRVLVAGGHYNGGTISGAELYDSTTGTWTATSAMSSPRHAHTGTLLADGRVLVTGGYNNSSVVSSAELYNPANGTWTATGAMNTPRWIHKSTLLPDGNVLTTGGQNGLGGTAYSSAEEYIPPAGAWTAASPMSYLRYYHSATLLTNGQVLVAGGYSGSSTLSSAELFSISPPAITNCVAPPSGLVGWWKADGNANDLVNGNNGVLQNAGYTNGVVGQAFSFDPLNLPYGTYSGVQISDQPAYALTNSLSIETWVRTRGNYGVIFFRGDRRSGLDPYAISVISNTNAFFKIMDANGNEVYVQAAISYNQWMHLAATLDGSSGKMSIYTNGFLAAQITTTNRPFGNLIPTASPGIGIGNVNDGFNNFPFEGEIDDLGLYNRALSAIEIQSIYNAGSAGKCLDSVPPTITSQPVNQTVTGGNNANFSVTAIGTPPLLYQWRFYGTNISSATNSTLRFANAQFTNAGTYSVVVSNSFGFTNSVNAILQVLPPGAPSIQVNGQLAVGTIISVSSAQVSISGGFTNGYIFYTLDGSVPDFSSTLYAGAFTLTNTSIVRAMSLSADFSQTSEAPPVTVQIVPVYSLQTSVSGSGTLSLNPASGPYLSNSVVTLTATPAANWLFDHWTGDANGNQNPISVTMNGPRNVQAVFVAIPFYALTTSSVGSGTISVNPPTGPYLSNSVVTLTANGSASWPFDHWTGDATGGLNPVNVTMNGPRLVQAVFVRNFPITVSTPGGGNVTVNGQVIAPFTFYPVGSNLTITATASNGWSFLGWQGDANGTTNPLNLTVNQTNNIQAIFGTIVATNPLGAGSIVLSLTNPVPFGAILTASAVPDSGKYFVAWGGAASGTNTPTTIKVTNSNPTVSALFTTLPGGKYSLSVVVLGNGAVAISPQRNYYNPGDIVTLSATPTVGGTNFYGWAGSGSGSYSGSSNFTSVTMNGSIIETANFLPQTGSLLVNLAPPGAVSAGAQWQVDGSAWQSSGATVSNLSVGSHTITFVSVSGWIAPASQTSSILANQTTAAIGTYAVVSSNLLQLTGMAVSNGWFRFILNGPVCNMYVIQVSSNLLNWSALSTNTIPASGMVSLMDLGTANKPRIFYRAVPFGGTSAVAGMVSAWGGNNVGQTNVPAGLTNGIAVAGGYQHSLALNADGTVIGWGENDFGQTNPPVGLSNVIALAAGWGSSLALKCDGTLEEWGWDGGYGLYSTAHTLFNITSIAATWDCLMALQSDGKPLVWGKSTHGETNIPSGLVNVVAIAGGGYHCMALKKDGTVVAWGDNGYNQTNIPAGLGNVKAIAAGGGHCLALKTDGTVVAWGNNSFGLTNVPAGLTNVTAISAGSSHSLARRADGTVVVWGDNSFGQTNSPANLTNVFSISAGGFHNLAIKH